MRWPISLIAGALVCGLWAPAHGEQVKYYVWIDDDGVTHMEDRPPKDRDYETRIIEVDTGVSPPQSTFSSGSSGSSDTERRSSSRSGTTDESSLDELDAAIADEEQQRLESEGGTAQSGASTAEGSTAAPAGSAAPASGAAAGGSTATGGASAPAATFPPVIGP